MVQEKELLDNLAENWIAVAVKGMKSASPTSLKVFLRSVICKTESIISSLAKHFTS